MKRHFENLTNKVGRAVQHWWLMMLAGILCIAVAAVVFIFPLESYVTISILIGVVMLVTGAAQLIIAVTSGNYLAVRGYVVVGGVLDLLLGIFMCIYPGVTIVALPIITGIWIMYHSFMILAFASDLSTFRIGGSEWAICGGILLLLLSVLVLVNPFGAGIATVVVMAGLGLLLLGLLLCAVSIKFRDIHRQFEKEYPPLVCSAVYSMRAVTDVVSVAARNICDRHGQHIRPFLYSANNYICFEKKFISEQSNITITSHIIINQQTTV